MDSTVQKKYLGFFGKIFSSPVIKATLSKPAINFNNVVLPLPEGPRIHAIESFFNSKLTSFNIGLLLILSQF